MQMKNPLHPGEAIACSLAELGVTISAAARGPGVSRQQLHNLTAGRSDVTPEMAVKLEAAFGSTADNWLRMQANFNLANVRQRNVAASVKRFEPKVA